MKITEKVRNEIPVILKKHKNGLTFNQLFTELKKVFGDELIDEKGKDREGVLRGIVNRLSSKPIKNVIKENNGINVIYIYVDGALGELELATKSFLDEIKNKELLKSSVLDFDKDDREIYKKYEDLITQLHDLVNRK